MAGIFRKNDIRGIVGSDLTEEIALKIGYIFGTIVGSDKSITIAGDTRKTTPVLKNKIIEGIRKSGSDIYDLGIGPTPMVYFSCANFKEIDHGIMVTGSHNPIGQNGIKICDEDGASYTYQTMFSEIEKRLENLDIEDLNTIDFKGKKYDKNNIKKSYIDYLTNSLKIEDNLNIVIDIGRGATGNVIKQTLKENEKINVKFLNDKVNGSFHETPPDPAKPSAFDDLKKVVDEKTDIAICFDGDGDRIGFLTPDKEIISPDQITMLFAETLTKKQSNVKIIIDVKISKATKEYANQIGCEVILSQVGHSYIHELLIETGSQFAAELSGHYYFHDDYFGYDDGLYTAVRFLNLLSEMKAKNQTIINKLQELPKYFSTKEFRDPIPTEKQIKIIKELKQYAINNGASIIEIDGIRAEFDDAWFLVRSSGTEEALSYRVEGDTEVLRDNLLKVLKKIINR